MSVQCSRDQSEPSAINPPARPLALYLVQLFIIFLSFSFILLQKYQRGTQINQYGNAENKLSSTT